MSVTRTIAADHPDQRRVGMPPLHRPGLDHVSYRVDPTHELPIIATVSDAVSSNDYARFVNPTELACYQLGRVMAAMFPQLLTVPAPLLADYLEHTTGQGRLIEFPKEPG